MPNRPERKSSTTELKSLRLADAVVGYVGIFIVLAVLWVFRPFVVAELPVSEEVRIQAAVDRAVLKDRFYSAYGDYVAGVPVSR
ncbi:hypothetical protein Enr13x_24280 [Stieleria neptunia]|uniref:Uncharacterized protein n=1 Tax=Stieleria neptunia TaxID=2527979 RepID=A0A518HP05_9BACT|nr:hypothetical protein Enr13x_24280 [Stieleria neptunia]